MENWGYLEWGIVIVLLTIIVILLLHNLKSSNKNKESIMSNNNNNDEDFNGDVFGFEKQDLPGLGGSLPVEPIHELVLQQNNDANQLLILKIKLECANLILPDVSFGENDSIEIIQLKQGVMKVRKLLGELVGGELGK